MFFMEKFILTYVRSFRLGMSFKFSSLIKKVVWFHFYFRQGRLVYLYIIFYILRHFFKQKFWTFWFDLPKNLKMWSQVNFETHIVLLAIPWFMSWYTHVSMKGMAGCWQWRLIEIWGQVIWILCHVCKVCHILLTFLYSIEQKQVVALKSLSCKDTFSQILHPVINIIPPASSPVSNFQTPLVLLFRHWIFRMKQTFLNKSN